MSRRDYNHIQHIIKVQICRKCPKLEKYFFELGTLAKAECHRHKLSFPHSSTLPTATCSARVASPRRIWTGRWRLAGAQFRRQSTTWTTPLSDSAKPSRRSRFAFWFYTICWFAVRKYAQKTFFLGIACSSNITPSIRSEASGLTSSVASPRARLAPSSCAAAPSNSWQRRRGRCTTLSWLYAGRRETVVGYFDNRWNYTQYSYKGWLIRDDFSWLVEF